MHHRGRFLLLLAATLWLAGCGLFATREPEPPDSSKSDYAPATEPRIVVENIRTAISQLSTETYRRSISEDFAFTPASPVASDPVWDGWDDSAEHSYFSTLVASARPNAQPKLTLEDDELVSLSASRFAYEARYELRVPHTRPEAPTFAEGELRWELVLRDNEDLWYLQEWSDFSISEAATWSALKTAFYE